MKFDCLKTVKRDGKYYVGGKDQIDLPARGTPETDRLIKAGVISARPVDDAPEVSGDETGGDESGGDESGGDETGGDETGGDESGGDESGEAETADNGDAEAKADASAQPQHTGGGRRGKRR